MKYKIEDKSEATENKAVPQRTRGGWVTGTGRQETQGTQMN